jgi:hypothetical protein
MEMMMNLREEERGVGGGVGIVMGIGVEEEMEIFEKQVVDDSSIEKESTKMGNEELNKEDIEETVYQEQKRELEVEVNCGTERLDKGNETQREIEIGESSAGSEMEKAFAGKEKERQQVGKATSEEGIGLEKKA